MLLPAPISVKLKDFLPEPAGESKGAGERQDINKNAARTHIGYLPEGETKPVQNNAQAQQMLFGEQHAAVAVGMDFRVQRIADNHPAENSYGQRAETRVTDCRDRADPDSGGGQQAGQR